MANKGNSEGNHLVWLRLRQELRLGLCFNTKAKGVYRFISCEDMLPQCILAAHKAKTESGIQWAICVGENWNIPTTPLFFFYCGCACVNVHYMKH